MLFLATFILIVSLVLFSHYRSRATGNQRGEGWERNFQRIWDLGRSPPRTNFSIISCMDLVAKKFSQHMQARQFPLHSAESYRTKSLGTSFKMCCNGFQSTSVWARRILAEGPVSLLGILSPLPSNQMRSHSTVGVEYSFFEIHHLIPFRASSFPPVTRWC